MNLQTIQKLQKAGKPDHEIWKGFKSKIILLLKAKLKSRVKPNLKLVKRFAPNSQMGMFLMPEDNPHDVYVWPDGFWCLREEFNDRFRRENKYRVVELGTQEWFAVTKVETYLPAKLR